MDNNLTGGKPEKNPSVAVWLKYYDKDLYEAIDDQGIMGQLRPRFGNNLTFLYPADKSYRDKIIKMLNGSDATVGVNMIQSLIIVRENLSDAQDWNELRANIPNALGQKVEINDASGKTVNFANGATATLNKDFAARDSNISVWDYKGPEMPLDGKPAEFNKRAPRPPKKPSKLGGSGFPVYPDKNYLAKRLEDQALCLIRSSRENFESSNPYTASLVSLAQYLKNKNGDALKKFNLMCEPNSVAAFYAIVLPYTVGSLIESEIDSWLKETRGVCLESNPNGFWSDYVTKLGEIGHEYHSQLMESKDSLVGAAIKSTGESLYKNAFGPDSQLRLKGDEIRFLINTTMAGNELSETSMSQLFLDIKILYSPLASGSFFLVGNSRTDPVFLNTVSVFVSSRCFMSVPNPSPDRVKIISFNDALNSETDIDPETHFITDDQRYLSQTTSNDNANFVTGLKKVFASMPPDVKSKLLAELSS